ncbi:MAG: serine/threonine protein kinase bacterial [Planctomycetota bacterium]|nr:MAG: serine/threonine protein kinase bacterial [Planctomycetota bacterium]
MTDGTLTHPTPELLAAFGAGRLSDEESISVEEHLTDCVGCCQSLKHLPGDDSYVCLLREAVSEVDAATILLTPTVAAAGADTDGLRDGGTHPRLPVLPRELADHPRYRGIRVLGSGGMGAVYEAEHRLMRRRHPHVVTAFDAEQAGDVHFLAMEFIDGITLAELVQQRGPLPVPLACECIRQAALGLQQAHEQGMVHRDIKPGNLMVSQETRVSVKILDFGLARFASEADAVGADTSANTMLGTPDFMAPEQARDARSADIRSDIYSLGCTLHFLLTGEVPHPGLATAIERAIAHLERDPLPASVQRDDVPAGLQEVLQRMISQTQRARIRCS